MQSLILFTYALLYLVHDVRFGRTNLSLLAVVLPVKPDRAGGAGVMATGSRGLEEWTGRAAVVVIVIVIVVVASGVGVGVIADAAIVATEKRRRSGARTEPIVSDERCVVLDPIHTVSSDVDHRAGLIDRVYASQGSVHVLDRSLSSSSSSSNKRREREGTKSLLLASKATYIIFALVHPVGSCPALFRLGLD